MQILDGLGLICAASKVVRQIRHVVVKRGRINQLDSATDRLMELFSSLQQHGIVGNLLSEGMLERVLDIGDRWLLVDELPEL